MHHILEKNKRFSQAGASGEKKKRPPSGSNRIASLKNRQPSEQYQKLLSSAKPEVRQILETVSSIENDLRLRIQMYGKGAASTTECLQHYVKTCNDHGMHLIKNGEFKAATEILIQCEQILSSQCAGNFPSLKFQTYNNIAHCHNVQGNVRLSLKYLQKALEFGIEAEEISSGQTQLPLIETYLNIANANTFVGMLDQALEYADTAVQVSQRQLDEVMMQLDNPSLPQDLRDQYGQQYHSQINLHVMSFQSRGQILEKMKKYEEAIVEYQQGKQVIEANYGTQHQKYIELANAMNGAKLRTKYISHSNIPQQHQFDINNRGIQVQQLENANTLNVVTSDNVFLKEQEMMKPISQQKSRRRVLRPSSAKPPKSTSSSRRQHSLRVLVPATESIPNSRALQMYQPPRMNSSNCEWYANKDRSQSPKQPVISRKDFAFKIRSSSAKKSRKLRSSQKLQELQSSHTTIHNTSECNNCHSQLEEIRQMHIEQQRLMNTIMQQQMTSSQTQPQLPQQMQAQQHSQMPPAGGHPYYQQHYPPPPYYYPYPMPPPPMVPHPGMYAMPPPPYPYPYPYQMPPPPMSQFNPTINNFMHQTSQSDQSNKKEQYSPEHRFHIPHLPQHPRYAYNNQEAQSVTTYTDLNERDSEFAELTQNRISSAREQKVTREIPNVYKEEAKREEIQRQEIKKEDIKKIPISKPQPKQPQQRPISKPQGETKVLKQKMHEAAIKIQKYFRKYRFERLYKLMTSLNKRKFLFHKQLIAYRGEKKGKVVILNVSLISVKKKYKYVPQSVVFEFYKRKKKTLVMEITHKVKAFGFSNPDTANNQDIFNRVKAYLSQLRFKSSSLETIKKQFLENVGVYNPNYSKMEFIDPQYFTEGLDYIKKVKYESPKKQQTIKEEKKVEFVEEQKSYSIHDDYDDQFSSHSDINESIGEEPVALQEVPKQEPAKVIQPEPKVEVQKQKTVEQKKKSVSSKSSSSSKNSFVEEYIQDEYSIDHESELQESKQQVDQQQQQPIQIDTTQKKQDKMKALIKLQSAAKGYLIRKNFQTILQEAKSQVLTFACVKRNNKYFMVKVRLFSGKNNQQTYSFIVSLQSGKKTLPFGLKLKDIPVPLSELNNYIQDTIEIAYDDKSRKISNVTFNNANYSQTKQLQLIEDDLKYQQSLTEEQKMLVSKTTTAAQAKSKATRMSVERAAVIIQARIRTFLAQRRRAMLIQYDIVCSFIYRQGDYVAHVMVKKKKNKYEIMVRNCQGKKKTTKIKTEEIPFDRCFIREALKEALEIKWNKDGSTIEKVKYEPKNVNMTKIKETIQLQLEEIKDQRKEYDEMMKQMQPSKEESEHESINEEVYSDNEFDKEEEGTLQESPKKEEFKVNVEESVEKIKEEVAIKQEQIEEEKTKSNKKKKDKKDKKDKIEKKDKKDKKASKEEKEEKVIKIQSRIRGMITRNQYKPLLKKEHTMLMSLSRRLSNGTLYNIFLLKKNPNKVRSTKDTFYVITMRQADNVSEIYDLEITLEMAKKIFGKKNMTKEDLQKAVMFETNQHEFQMMLECLDMKQEDDFSLDFNKFRSMQSETQEITLHEFTYEKVEVKLSKVKEEDKYEMIDTSTHQKQSQRQDYEVIKEEASNLETSPDPIAKKAQKFDSLVKSAMKQPKEDFQSRKTKAVIMIQRRTRQFLTRKQYKALHSVNFTNKAKDPKKKLELKEQGVFKLCSLYFMYFLYSDKLEQEVKFTLKAINEKITIVSMKNINLADFGEEKVEIYEVIEYIKEQLMEKEEELLLDEQTGELRKDWQIQMHEFIEEHL